MAPGATALGLGSDGGVRQWWYSAHLHRQRGCLSLAAVPNAARQWWKSARCSAVVPGAREMRRCICGQGSASASVATVGERQFRVLRSSKEVYTAVYEMKGCNFNVHGHVPKYESYWVVSMLE
ncbi:hypothetical protein E2562_035192 [Oryza meyeriana var. granulata]|uniref:Uncharacterized protein n=1 Tax=Oryza meyeriana var. granulata TaxID=110450 RepID=A0A6G1D9C0_9ORYZ|nr:hypothetical protein E2562_035192 [Oryza meyeriana var. granulata]